MTCEIYRYRFQPETDMDQVEEILLLSTMAAEGLLGRSRVHLDAGFRCEPAAFTAEIDGGSDVGDAIARVFTALLSTTLGETAFKVTRIKREECK